MKERRGVCPECGQTKAVTVRGVLRLHLPPRGSDGRQFRDACSGTGQAPKSYVDEPRVSPGWLAEREAALRVVAAAEAWRDRVAGLILGSHEVPLADAVDEWRRTRGE